MTTPRGKGVLIRVTPAEYAALIAATVFHASQLDDPNPAVADVAETRREAAALDRLITKYVRALPTPKENRHAAHP